MTWCKARTNSAADSTESYGLEEHLEDVVEQSDLHISSLTLELASDIVIKSLFLNKIILT